MGVLEVRGSVSSLGEFAGAWVSEREYTFRLYGRHALGFVSDACSGWFKIEGPIQ